MPELNHTHDPAARSWVASANAADADFPLQNLPYAMFAEAGTYAHWRAGVAIGDQVLDLAALHGKRLLQGLAAAALEAAAIPSQKVFGLNAFMATGPESWRALRHALFALLRDDATPDVQAAVQACLVPQARAIYRLPAQVANYTDFYTSIHHARNVGRVIRPDDPLTPNFQWLPIAYHGRASSVVVSGTAFHRPHGQALPPGAKAPVYGPCARLDYELELGFYIGHGNALGQPVPLAAAEDQIFGTCLLNDWSARDVQAWEYQPLGPFLSKNFASTVSPWIVTLEALAPFRVPAVARPAPEPQPLAYLDSADNRAHGGLDIQLTVGLESARHRAQGLPAAELSRTSFRHQYWTLAQMVTQHTVGGCNLQSGDLLGTGTISGPTPAEAGAMVELSQGGRQAIPLAGTGETRTFLEDGDTLTLRAYCEAPGAVRIGLGTVSGTIVAAEA